MSAQRILNIDDVELAPMGDGKGFKARRGAIGPKLGSVGLGCALVVTPPGARAYPFHRHHVGHELFFIISGTGETRLDGETRPVRAGDVIAAPAGTEAHQIVNTGTEDLKYLAMSTMGEADVIEYPDSGKIAAAAGIKNADFKTATFRAVGRITPTDYYDGEPGE